MTHYNIWRDSRLAPFSIGFDSLFDTFDRVGEIHKSETYPPYNIKKLSDEKFAIEMAVAGFSKKDITGIVRLYFLSKQILLNTNPD